MNTSNHPTAVIVLAGGKGRRMESDLAKVLHPLADTPMVHHVLEAAKGLEPIVMIVGHQADAVKSNVAATFPGVKFAYQAEQLGTGHAVQQTEQALKGFVGDVIILSGDVPLVTPHLVRNLQTQHISKNEAITVLTTTLDDATGLGRIIRDKNGNFKKIIEHRDASETQRQIHEINTGIYMVKAPLIFELLKDVSNDNASGEFYLTDIIALASDRGLAVNTLHVDDGLALLGVNSPSQLKEAEAIYQQRCLVKKEA